MLATTNVIHDYPNDLLLQRQVTTVWKGDWTTIPWKKAFKVVRNLRQRIFRATKAGDLKKVKQLQKLMLRCTSNILVSVRRVTQVNQGKDTPGVDKVLIKTPTERSKLVNELTTFTPWRAKPVKRVYIPKSNGKLRPRGIPTIRDRCMQAIVKNALEPFWEAKFEGISYGFRPGRSCHDAIAKIFLFACLNRRKKWILDADIKGAFDNIDHNFLIKRIGKYQFPAMELIKQWLKAGVMEEGRYRDIDSGTPQGGVINPLLANIALHGMEHALKVKYDNRGIVVGPRAVVRYADDFVVFCESERDAEKSKQRLEKMLAKRGLELSPEKTRIVHITKGFDFLGFNIRQYEAPNCTRSGFKLLITLSKESRMKIRKKLKEEWKRMVSAPVGAVIKRINPIVRGWGNYFRIGVSSKVFSELDSHQFKRQDRFVNRRHPNKPAYWKKGKYWGRIKGRNDNWVFQDKRTGAYMLKFSWIPIQRHVMVKQDASPDDPTLKDYWEDRTKRIRKEPLKEVRHKLFMQQKGICPLCGQPLESMDETGQEELHVHHMQRRKDGGTNELSNLRLVHMYCHQQVHSTVARGSK